MRVEEGLGELDQALNQGGAGYGYVFIIHGVGTGQMKKAVLEFLKKHPMVTRSEPDEGNGGDGCTIAYLQ
jgi:DNA mismatch repair protein MutS2